MIERAGGARFLLEAAETLGVGRILGRQDLDRHVPPNPRVVGAIHLAHPALANQGVDAVRTQRSTGLEIQHRECVEDISALAPALTRRRAP